MPDRDRTTIYTIGHSKHTSSAFVELLRRHDIGLVVDVRSIPYSRRVPQANRQTLAQTLASIDIEYRWMGEQLGGKPGGEIPDYDQLRTRPSFQQGIAELVSLAREHPTAVMCAEGDHRGCHRHKLIAPSLLEQGFTLLHIQPDGSLVNESVEPRQLTLL